MSTTVFSVNMTKHEADSILKVLVYANLYSPDDVKFTSYISVDGIVQQVCSANIILDGNPSNGRLPLSPFAFLNNIAAGAHTITFDITNNERSSVDLTIQPGATIEITEIKRAAR